MGRCLAVVSAALAVAASFASPASAIVRDGGITVHGTFADIERQLELARDVGVPWVQMHVGWDELEPQRDSYEVPGGPGSAVWADLRARVEYAKRLNLRVLLKLSGSPAWASGASPEETWRHPPTPENVPEYAEFLSDLVTRLGDSIDAYIAWNEVNYPFFWANTNVGAYVQLQKAVYPAIKQRDPTAVVLSATLAPLTGQGGSTNPFDYLEAAYGAGLRGSVDAIAWNSYPPSAPEDDVKDASGRPLPAIFPAQLFLKSMLDRLDPGRPVWITELAWSTCIDCTAFRGNLGNIVDEATQAEYLTRAFVYRRRYLGDGVPRIFWWLLRDGPDRRAWTHNQGLVRHDWSPKPALAALRALNDPAASGPGGGGGGGGGNPDSPSSPGGSPTPGGTATPSRTTISRAVLRVGLPTSRRLRDGRRVALGRLKLTTPRAGFLRLDVTVTVARGRTNVRIEGWRARRWVLITRTALARSSRIRATIRDRGYLALRIRASLPRTTRMAVGRAVPVPGVAVAPR